MAGHLLTLAQDGVPDGSHPHLEDSNGLEGGSVGLVLERSDDELCLPGQAVLREPGTRQSSTLSNTCRSTSN
ncbi:Imm32 family immunity protein [Streptomyces sp. NBC_01744]|uniref:Imm32 family immunity protein n=1 Tax=Streptomyces sp. NBC_01744 TaxID=2975927 RepID=UPI003D9A71C4